jgi:predicted short-subunit dehydrogenase-like oxidoreductase (DUF2520 family)
MGPVPIRVTLVGAGQVGRALEKALRAREIACKLLRYRAGRFGDLTETTLVLICVRDGQIPDVVARLRRTTLGSQTVVAHVSGSVGQEVLLPLRPLCRGIGQLHPFSSIRAIGHASHFAGSYFLGDGDRASMHTLRRFVCLLGGKFVNGKNVERRTYHLAAAMLANGSVALLDAAARLLSQAKIAPRTAEMMLVELERTVLVNVEKQGLARALTGPIRRGDVGTLELHLRELQHADRCTRELYRSLARSQLTLVRRLSELEPSVIRRMKRLVGQTACCDAAAASPAPTEALKGRASCAEHRAARLKDALRSPRGPTKA